MSFIKKIAQSLGFSNEPEEETPVYTAKNITDMTGKEKSQPAKNTNTPTPAKVEPVVAPIKKDVEGVKMSTPAQQPQNIVPDILLDKIVELINASFPDFVRNCIDIENEKKYIYEQLGDTFKNYVVNLNDTARQQSEANINSARMQLDSEMSNLRRKATELEEQKAELKNQQLSTERQKRALNEKVHDLESRINTLEAEKEQYELENKSLINKLKVSGIKQQEVDDAQEEVNRLLNVIQEMKKNGTVPTEVENNLAQKDTAIQALKTELEQVLNLNTSLNAELTQHKEASAAFAQERQVLTDTLMEKEKELTQKAGELQAIKSENENALQALRAELEQATNMNVTLTNNLTQHNEASATFAQERQALAETILNKDNTIAQLTSEIEILKSEKENAVQAKGENENTVQALKAELEQVQNINTTLNNDLNQYKEASAAFAQEKQLLTESILNKDNTIAQLSNEIEAVKNEKEAAIQTLKSENEKAIESLKSENKAALQAMKDENEAVKQDAALLRTSVQSAHEAHEALEETNKRCNALEIANHQMKQERETMTKQLADAMRALEESRSQVLHCNEKISQLNMQITEQEEIADVQKRVQELATQKSQLQKEITQANNDNKELHKQIEERDKEIISMRMSAAKQAKSTDSEDLVKANNMIDALKKQRQELISQTASLRSQNRAYENQIASLESKLKNAGNEQDVIEFNNATDIDDAINWMMPVLPDSLEEEARRREEEEARRREEEERERQAEKARRAMRDDTSTQMSLW